MQAASISDTRRYRRDEKGDITEADDHLMRATGLMQVHGLGLAITEYLAMSEAEAFDPLEDERIYNRAVYMDERRRALETWAKLIIGSAAESSNVVSMPAGTATVGNDRSRG